MTEPPIREPLRHDAKKVRELSRIAHPKMPESLAIELSGIATDQQPDTAVSTWKRTSDGTTMKVPFLHTMRVIAPPDHQARALAFCAPPGRWIIAQGRDSNMSIDDRALLAGALVECQLLATAPRWRGRGYASRLMEDVEHRYRTAGYRAVCVVIEHDNEAALTWYRKRGFTVGDLHTWPVIQIWKNRMHQTAHYNHLDNSQLIGFKALHDDVSIMELNGTVHVRGLLG